MQKYERHIKFGMFLLVIMLLFIPLIQKSANLFSIRPLDGAIEEVELTDFSFKKWFTSEYQDNADEFTKAKIGFAPSFIRLNNQLKYSLFGKISAQGVIKGRNGYFYEENYIKTTLGLDFIGEERIEQQVKELSIIRDSLAKHNTQLVILLAAGKGSFYLDFFPKKYDTVQQGTTNYEVYKKLLAENQINVFDVKGWFDSSKPIINPKNKLFTKTGIHWSTYADYLVLDSLLSYFESLVDLPFPKVKLDTIKYSKTPFYRDNDLEKGMNLLFKLDDFEMAYPEFHRENEEQNINKVLTMADSYYWTLFNFGVSRDYFGDGEFWYYNQIRYPNQYIEDSPVAAINTKEEMVKNEIVLIICTDANLYKFDSSFIEPIKADFGLVLNVEDSVKP